VIITLLSNPVKRRILSPMTEEKNTSKDIIDLYVRTYRSALKSSGEILVSTLAESYRPIASILHLAVDNPQKVDIACLIYTFLRLPSVIAKTELIVLGQSSEVFQKKLNKNVEKWQKVSAVSRRRAAFFDNEKTLACFIASVSDIDDLVNGVTALQTEWNKFHNLLTAEYSSFEIGLNDFDKNKGFEKFGVSGEDWQRFQSALGENFHQTFRAIYEKGLNLKIRLLSGCWVDYEKVASRWWQNISTKLPEICEKPIYFISSNTHSFVNLLSGFCERFKKEILAFCEKDKELSKNLEKIKSGAFPLTETDFFYFAAKNFLSSKPEFVKEKEKMEQAAGIIQIPAVHYLNSLAQIFPVSALAGAALDQRINIKNKQSLAKSNGLILNIDYPLGFTAYHILEKILAAAEEVRGVYILGKAATLNGKIGDIIIPKVAFDEHSENTFLIKNSFNNNFPYSLQTGSVFDNQRSVSVLSAFLENKGLIDHYSENGYTIIEMENGPYLSAVCEANFPQRYPEKTVVDLNSPPFDLGIINYASDTPYSKAKNLGSRELSLDGVEATYLSSIAILQRIINLES